MKLNKTITKAGVALCAAFALTSTASAAFISGTIGFFGSFNVGATSVTFPSAFVFNTTGDYAAVPDFETFLGAGENFGPLIFSPLTTPQNLWTLIYDGDTYSFEISSMLPILDGLETVGWKGNGTASISGFEDTTGYWEVTKNIGATFSAGVEVPDGGATVALLGISLLGLHTASRKLRKA